MPKASEQPLAWTSCKAIVFDCDGVLLDSNPLKTECFREVLQANGFAAADIGRFLTFQRENFGLSRYRLFEQLLEWDLAIRPAVTWSELLQGYSEAVSSRYMRCETTLDMWPTVTALAAKLPLYIASGSDEAELRHVLAVRGQASPFRLILGSPATKESNLRRVLAELPERTSPDDVLFVGDAEADWRAAQATGLRFVYMDQYSTVQTRMRSLSHEAGFPMIRRLPDLMELPHHSWTRGAIST